MSITNRLIVWALFSLSAGAVAAQERVSVIRHMDTATLQSMRNVLAWQKSFEGMSQAALVSKLGQPKATEDGGINAVTKKPMQTMVYPINPFSSLRLTLHEGVVMAVTTILIPE